MASTDAQAVWKELSEHMKTSSKGASEKRRLTQYVTNTVLDDTFKGTTEQFVLHFNEQFRQLEEISEDDERLPPSVKLTLLQTAVRSINDLRIVETLDKFQSTTHGHGSSTSLSYDTYYDLLINACVRYDKTKNANIGKRRNVYATNIDDTFVDLPTACIDDVPDSPYGGIDLPPDEFYQVHALSSRHPPPQRPGQPSRPTFRSQSQNPRPTNPIRRYDGPIFLPPQIYRLLSENALKALKAYNTEAISRFHKRKVHNTEIVEEPQDDPPGPPVSENDLPDLPDLPESDLNIPDDPILDFVNSQCHSSEDLDQALQVYQAFQIPCPQDSTMTPERSINHHFTYHVAQASQAKHGSLVDRGANGGLAGSDVRILSRSSRKCTVTGIDSHELQGHDVVQCVALVQTNHGIVNLIMNEYACYGKGHTIHSSGQIEWFKKSVDDRSVQVGGKQRICTTDGYAMPLTCRGGLMYLSLLGKPTDQDLERYPAVHLTGPHEWDPSVLDYTHPSGDGEPPWSNDPDERYAFDPNFDEFGDYTQRAIQTLSILDDSSSTLTPCSTYIANQHDFRTYQHAVKHEAPDYEKFRPYFGWVNVDTVQKTMEQSTQWGVSLPNTFPMKRHLKSRNPALNVPRRHEAVATDTVFSAVDSGVKQAQVFVGRDTLVADAYPMKSGKQFVNTLEDNIRRHGAMDKLLSDSAKTEISNKVMDILRAYHISNWHSEPYHQNQNLAGWRYRTIKSWTNTVVNRSGAPANCWLLFLIYVCYLLNYIACTALDGKIPLLALTGITPDISIILLFTFYQPVFYATYDQHFPSESEERAGYWVGFGEHCGDAMTHKILDQDTQKIIFRSAVKPKKSSTPNHRLAPHGGEVSTSSDPSEDKISSGSPLGSPEGSSPAQKAPTVFIRSRDEEIPSGSKPMPTFDPSDLIGRTFLLPPEENGERHRAKVT